MKAFVLAIIIGVAAGISGEAAAQKSTAMKWGQITGAVYGAAVHCDVAEKQRVQFLDAVSAKIALNALSQADRREAAVEFIEFKRRNLREPERGCIDIRQDFKDLVRALKSTSQGEKWRAIANDKLARRKWKP